jgi:hypothetical protein
MGYACPVCETPQRDGEHLAHHLAFTAMLHGGDHEAWLDDRVPDWSDREPAGLAAEVTPHAEDAEYHEVFEDTVNRGRPDVDLGAHDGVGPGGHDHADHDHSDHGHAAGGGPGAIGSAGEADPEVAEAIREAREMARKAGDDADDESEDDEGAEGDTAGGGAPDEPSA